MKKFYFFKSVLAMCMIALCGTAKADVISSTFTNSDLSVGAGEPTWTTSHVGFKNFEGKQTNRGVQFGSENNPAGEFTVTSTEAFTKVTTVKVTASAAAKGNTIAVKVGETALGETATIASGTTNANTVYTFSGEAADGVITISVNAAIKAVYIKTIEITYEGEGGGDTPVDPGVDVAAPVITPATGYFANEVEVAIAAEDGLTVYYTTDGTEPTTGSAVYSEPFKITAETEKVEVTVKAIAVDKDGNKSDVVSTKFTVLVVKPMDVPEGCIGFDFIMNPWELELGEKDGATGDILAPITQDGATLSFDKGEASTPARMWSYNGGGQLRVYNKSTFTITAPAGKNITKITFAYANSGTITAAQGTLTGSEWTGTEGSVTFAVTKNIQISTILLTLDGEEEVVVAAPVITPPTGTYTEAQTVTITAGDGLKIFYYTGENAEDAKEYTQPFEVTETTTVTAWAQDSDDKQSSKVTSVITIKELPAYTTIAAMKEAATTTKTQSVFTFENLLVTGVAKTSLYVSDGTDGFLFYGVTPTVKKGDKISGSITGNLYLYNALTEMSDVSYNGVTVASEGNEVKPAIVEISDITGSIKDYENEFIRLENVTFQAAGLTEKNVTIEDGNGDQIIVRDNFGVLTDMVFDTEKTYNVNVFVANYKGTAQLYPLTAQDIELITNLANPESAWEKDSLIMFAGSARNMQNTFTTKSDGAVTYTSSNEDVVTVDENGVLTWKKDGVATIYAETPETENYQASRVSFIYAAITGTGAFETPYTVADARFLCGTTYLTGDNAWVKGIVVGYVDGTNLNTGAIFEAAEAGTDKPNLLLADSKDAATVAECLPVQLASKTVVRTDVQPSTDYQKEIWLYGSIEKYFGVAGMKNPSDYSKDGKNKATGIETIKVENAAKAIYTLSGQKVNAITKGGIYIINGKKVLVK